MLKKNLLKIHKWLGLLAGIVILLMGLTGSLIVFDDEIEDFIHRDVINQPDSSEPVSVDKAYDSIVDVHPNWHVRFKFIPEKANRTIEAEIRRPDARRFLYVDPATGEILRDLDSNDTFSYWMLKLHYQLHSGFAGELILLIAGFMFISSLITGFWFYRKATWRVLTFKVCPRFRNLQSGSSELHRSVGVWALVFNLITAGTGTFILLTIVLSHVKNSGEPAPMPDPPAIEVSIDHIMEKARQTYPGFDPSYISMPSEEGRSITLYGHMDTDLPIHYMFSNYVRYNPQTGEESGTFFIKDQPITTHLYSFTYPLHFGDWGGIFIKILYSFFGIAPAILSITGFIIWRQRGQKRKRKLQSRRNANLHRRVEQVEVEQQKSEVPASA